MSKRIPEPWLTFLSEVDRALTRTTEVHCLGGFVLSVLWALPRPTGDIDFIEIRPNTAGDELMKIAGEGSKLGEKHHLHFHRVTIATYPDDYESRLIVITPKGCRRLRLKALEVHDVVLAKLSRNSPRDRADVEFLASRGALDRRLLKERFESELRPYVHNEAREALTLQLWLDELFGRREK
jgi:uncharacterized nucleotidyltransferase DUF6036